MTGCLSTNPIRPSPRGKLRPAWASRRSGSSRAKCGRFSAGILGCSIRPIDRIEGQAADGDVVDLLSDKGQVRRPRHYSTARAAFASGSIPGRRPNRSTMHFWRRRLETAVATSRATSATTVPQGAARLVFSEGDGLSGLIVDRYADYLAIQVDGAGDGRAAAADRPMLVELVRSARHHDPHRTRTWPDRRGRICPTDRTGATCPRDRCDRRARPPL